MMLRSRTDLVFSLVLLAVSAWLAFGPGQATTLVRVAIERASGGTETLEIRPGWWGRYRLTLTREGSRGSEVDRVKVDSHLSHAEVGAFMVQVDPKTFTARPKCSNTNQPRRDCVALEFESDDVTFSGQGYVDENRRCSDATEALIKRILAQR